MIFPLFLVPDREAGKVHALNVLSSRFPVGCLVLWPEDDNKLHLAGGVTTVGSAAKPNLARTSARCFWRGALAPTAAQAIETQNIDPFIRVRCYRVRRDVRVFRSWAGIRGLTELSIDLERAVELRAGVGPPYQEYLFCMRVRPHSTLIAGTSPYRMRPPKPSNLVYKGRDRM